MSRKILIVAILSLVSIGLLVYFEGGSEVPSGQRPLENLTSQNLASIEDEFNGAKNDLRLLLLLSPT